MKKPVLLCILDGWGVKRGGAHDAISLAKTPVFNELLKTCPNSVLETSGLAVGLPDGQMGNSEVGHMNIGGGRIVMQTLPKIDVSIKNGQLKNHKVIQNQIETLKDNGGSLHLMGLVSDGGVHAHQDHIIYLAKLYAENGVNVKIHAFTDGRDTPPNSAIDFVAHLVKQTAGYENIMIATIGGRYYGMDRDKRWDRVAKAYNAIVTPTEQSERRGLAEPPSKIPTPSGRDDIGGFESPVELIKQSYQNNVNDEFILPSVNKNYNGMKDGDGILMANFRADRARQILEALTNDNFKEFHRNKKIKFSTAVGMVEYSENLNKNLKTIFPSEVVSNTIGEVIANLGLKQLRIAETEKYAHVTFFFNGGEENVFAGEERIMVQSPKVATYDLQPEMSANELTEKLVTAINGKKFDLIVCNYANGDMVGHTGIMSAAIKAVETLDACMGKLKTAIEKTDGVMIISADHGNVEEMVDENGLPHTQHTIGAVPFIIVNLDSGFRQNDAGEVKLKNGRLCDIAPTILDIMGIEKPAEMNGVSLL
jgi:2,3-bisphosphoglycerate-independent phosphoglycerate mutase